MTFGQLFTAMNPDVKVRENSTCMWLFFDEVNHYTIAAEWWKREIPDYAVELLKEQEPRLLTLEEACVLDVCWLEWRRHGRKPVACRIIMRKDYAGNPMPVVHRFFEEPTGYSKKNYGKDWRCWSAKPTDKQRWEAKWNG